MSQWEGLEEGLRAMFWLALVGFVCCLSLGAVAVWWLFHHVSLVVR